MSVYDFLMGELERLDNTEDKTILIPHDEYRRLVIVGGSHDYAKLKRSSGTEMITRDYQKWLLRAIDLIIKTNPDIVKEIKI